MSGFLREAPPLPRPVTFDQFWADLTFLHWPVDPGTVARFFPPGARPDVIDGVTYVGLVPFVMRNLRLGSALRLPYFGTFAETNVRLYSVDDAGRHGVLFRSLETERLAAVAASRAALAIPYTWAKMRVDRDGESLRYRSVRRWPQRGLGCQVIVRVGPPIEPTPLEAWLTARWGAHTRKAGRTWWLPNEHATWPLHSAEIEGLADELVAAAGVVGTGPPLRPLYSPGVHARFGRPTRVA
ncbi:YqjF family protein [Mycobacterium sp. C3-094]